MIEQTTEASKSSLKPAPQNAAEGTAAASAPQNSGTAPASGTEAAPALSQQASKGEKLYSWIVYSGVNYWVNLLSSIAIADYFCNLNGKKIIENGANAIAKTMAGGDKLRHAKVFGQAQTALRTLTLLSGGWLLIVPMKYMEDNKRPMVHWLNDKLGVDQTAADGHKMSPDEIFIEQEQPKQSWLNVLLRRTLATAAVVGTGQVLNEGFRDRGKSQAFVKAHPGSKEDPHGGKARVEKWVVDTVNSGLNTVGASSLTKDKNGFFQRYLALAALDTVFTKITAVIMHVTNGAKKANMPGEIGDTASPPLKESKLNRITTKTWQEQRAEMRRAEWGEPATDSKTAQEATAETPAAKSPEQTAAATTPQPAPASELTTNPDLERFKRKPVTKSDNYTSLAEKKSQDSPAAAV